MKYYETWNSKTNWGTWIPSASSILDDGCYYVIPSGFSAPVAGEIDGYTVASDTSLIGAQLGADIEPSVFWFLVKGGQAISIGRWGLEPGFLNEPAIDVDGLAFEGFFFYTKDGTGDFFVDFQVFKSKSGDLVYYNSNLEKTLTVPDDVEIFPRWTHPEQGNQRLETEDLNLLV
jgi:hypothetical protein